MSALTDLRDQMKQQINDLQDQKALLQGQLSVVQTQLTALKADYQALLDYLATKGIT